MNEDNLKTEKEFDIKEIYTPLSVAKEEIWRRWNDKKLRKKVEDFLGGDLPEVFKKEPRAFLGRNIASPNFELKYFLNLAQEIKLIASFIEHSEDKFVSKNPDKYHMARMYFYNGNGKKNGNKLSAINIIDFNKYQGKKIKNINTIWGENFVGFHRKILKNAFPEIHSDNIFDISNILDLKNKKMSECYEKYLALFIFSGVLFENFLLNKGFDDFTIKVVLPSISKINKKFGVKPLIVPLAPIDDQADLYWWCYSEKLKIFCKK